MSVIVALIIGGVAGYLILVGIFWLADAITSKVKRDSE